jgi:predicted ATPase
MLFVIARHALGESLYFLGEFSLAREHFEQGIAVYDAHEHNPQHSGFVQDPGMACLSVGASVLWFLGYPDQAWKRSQASITLAQGLSHPFSLAYALVCATLLSQLRREARLTREQAEKTINFSTEQRLTMFLEMGTQLRAWAVTEQGQKEESGQQGRGNIAGRNIKAKMYRSYLLALRGEACGRRGQVEEGLALVAEALDFADKVGERFYKAELYRLKGQLTMQSQVQGPKSKVEEAVEEYFHKAIEIAQRQQAKSLELRAVMSLSRLWQRQGKKVEAHNLLSEIYHWFTEGFDTKDLQEAQTLLAALDRR